MRNSYKEWTEDDIELLHYMVKKGIPMRRMTQVLGRTRRAIRMAFQNVLYQQCIQHDSEDVADAYNYELDELINFVPKKYYQPLTDADVDVEPTFNLTWTTTFFTGLLASACIYYYGTLIKQNMP